LTDINDIEDLAPDVNTAQRMSDSLHEGSLHWNELEDEVSDEDFQDGDEVYCGLCGDGYDTWKEVQMHMFGSHYETVKEDAKEWLKLV